jgi:two-component system response regulator DegU
MILIVDDNAKMRGTIKLVIGKAARDAIECDSGTEAIKLYGEFHPDWVLMDIRMKGMDGITATRKIMGENPDAHVVIVTNYDDDDFRKDAKEAGAFAYVIKDDLSLLENILRGEEHS